MDYCALLYARSGLRFIIRLQEDAWIVPTRALGRATDPLKYGHISVRVTLAEPITLDHEHRAEIFWSILVPRNT